MATKSPKNSDEIPPYEMLYFKYLIELNNAEIKVYWQKATYFWGFIGALLGGTLLLNLHEKDYLLSELIVEALGVIFSFSWYLVNRGSTYWSEHWEKKLEKSCKELKFDYFDHMQRNRNSYRIFSPYDFSVTKINILLSFIIFLVFIFMFFSSIFRTHFDTKEINFLITLLLTITTIGYIIALPCFSRPKRD